MHHLFFFFSDWTSGFEVAAPGGISGTAAGRNNIYIWTIENTKGDIRKKNVQKRNEEEE